MLSMSDRCRVLNRSLLIVIGRRNFCETRSKRNVEVYRGKNLDRHRRDKPF